MSLADYALLAPIAGYFLWLLFRPRKKKCRGCCESCRGCKCVNNE